MMIKAHRVDPHIFQELKIANNRFILILLIVAIRINPGIIGTIDLPIFILVGQHPVAMRNKRGVIRRFSDGACAVRDAANDIRRIIHKELPMPVDILRQMDSPLP